MAADKRAFHTPRSSAPQERAYPSSLSTFMSRSQVSHRNQHSLARPLHLPFFWYSHPGYHHVAIRSLISEASATTKRWEKKRMTVNSLKIHCICVWTCRNAMHCKILNNRGLGGRERESNRGVNLAKV
jgi:hypothetical protein